MLIAVIVVVLILLAALIGAVAFAVNSSVIRPKSDVVDYESLDEMRKIRYKIRQRNNQYLYDRNPEDLSLTDKFGNELKAWFVPAIGSKKFVICIHGYKCNGPDECSHLFPFYNDKLGFNYLLPDHAAHGRSSGKHIGFGAYEADNLLLWVNYLIERFGNDIEIVLHGISMGAATAMLANESNPPEQVKVIVEDCGYTSADEIITNTIKNKIGFNCPLATKAIFLVAKLFFGYDMNKADCIGRMKDAKAPILFVHGAADTFVPFNMGERLYDACASVPKDKLFVEGAVHAYCYYDAKEAYEEKMIEFFSKHLDDFNMISNK